MLRPHLDAGDDLSAGLRCYLQAAYPVDDVPGLPDDYRHGVPDAALQGFCKLLDVGVEAPVIELCQFHDVHPAQVVDAGERCLGPRLDVRQLPGHGLDVHFIEAASDDSASVLLLEVIRGPVEQDVHGPPLAQGLSAHILHRYLLEAHARGHKMSLVAAQDFAALIGVDREQKAQLAEGQLREGQTLFIVAPGVILRRSHGVDGDKFNHGAATSVSSPGRFLPGRRYRRPGCSRPGACSVGPRP